jgi:hypothetical protein
MDAQDTAPNDELLLPLLKALAAQLALYSTRPMCVCVCVCVCVVEQRVTCINSNTAVPPAATLSPTPRQTQRTSSGDFS